MITTGITWSTLISSRDLANQSTYKRWRRSSLPHAQKQPFWMATKATSTPSEYHHKERVTLAEDTTTTLSQSFKQQITSVKNAPRTIWDKSTHSQFWCTKMMLKATQWSLMTRPRSTWLNMASKVKAFSTQKESRLAVSRPKTTSNRSQSFNLTPQKSQRKKQENESIFF